LVLLLYFSVEVGLEVGGEGFLVRVAGSEGLSHALVFLLLGFVLTFGRRTLDVLELLQAGIADFGLGTGQDVGRLGDNFSVGISMVLDICLGVVGTHVGVGGAHPE